MSEEYSVGYNAGYQEGYNAAMNSMPTQLKTWVGLTMEEAREIQIRMVYGNHSFLKVIEAIKAKLKEKNT